MTLAQILRKHWSAYVAHQGGPSKIPPTHWRAVEAVLACGTPRLGGSLQRCRRCHHEHFVYHSCNHRACPRCGGRDQQLWTARQQARRLPVPYFMVTLTVPEEIRWVFRRHDRLAYNLLFASSAAALKELFADPRHFGGQPGFTAVLHTWTRQMQFHPHLHLLVPAAAFNPERCEAVRSPHPEYLLPHAAIATRFREHFLGELYRNHRAIHASLDPGIARRKWNVNVQFVGRGKQAMHYLAAYVKKSAISQSRLMGYDASGRLRVAWTSSEDGKRRIMTLTAVEFIRRWLQHVLPKGLTRVRHYGYLSAAAHKTFRRLRFLLGGRHHPVVLPPDQPVPCPQCEGPTEPIRRIAPARGPPLSRALLPQS